MNTTIDLSAKVTMLDGEMPGPSLGRTIAEHVLAKVSQGDALKLMAWARTLNADEPLTLDSSDFETLYKLIENSQVIFNIVKAPALQAMIDAKRAAPLPTEK